MNYKDYIESINPPEGIKEKALNSVEQSRKKRVLWKTLLSAAAVFAVALTTVLTIQPNTPADKTVLPTESTTETLIQNEISDEDTVKSIPRILIVNGSEYFEDRKSSITVSESELTSLGTVSESSFVSSEDVDSELLGAQIYGLDNNTSLLVYSDGKYYLFHKTN